MKQLTILMLSFFFFPVLSYAQVLVGGMDEYIDYANIVRNSSGPNNKYSEMAGIPFLNEDFEMGTVKLRNGQLYKGPLRYDIYADEIEFKTKDGKIYEIRNPETVEKVAIGERKFLCFAKEEGRNMDGLFEELVNGDFTLLSKHRVYLKDAVPAKPYVEPKPATFIKKKSNYLVIDTEGDVISVASKQDLLILASNTSEAKSFIKKNKVKIGDE
ncbi:MAG: hypothetical protein R3182_10290, partial [Draconibacterium sp.]|nr:hypothetical protein [Draconibacterium sp.]